MGGGRRRGERQHHHRLATPHMTLHSPAGVARALSASFRSAGFAASTTRACEAVALPAVDPACDTAAARQVTTHEQLSKARDDTPHGLVALRGGRLRVREKEGTKLAPLLRRCASAWMAPASASLPCQSSPPSCASTSSACAPASRCDAVPGGKGSRHHQHMQSRNTFTPQTPSD